MRAVLRADTEVEEVMQQSYVAAFGALSSFAHASKFSTWLIRIGLNAALASRRRSAQLVPLPQDSSSDEETPGELLPSTQPSPEDRASAGELRLLLEQVLDGLPLAYRTVVMLREVEGLSTAETAEALDVSEDVVKTRLHRGKLLARETLDAWTWQSAASAFLFHAPRCDRVVAVVLGQLLEAG
ncbi:MAG: sigma-70 family RNA polymerase sigma factor [Myxococcaceae bacterium]